jgi:hypothetical protein
MQSDSLGKMIMNTLMSGYGVGLRHGVQVAITAMLLASGVTAAQTPEAPMVERDIHMVEIGRVNGVNGAPVSITIDNRAYAVTEETYVDGNPLKGDNNAMAKTLRKLVGSDVGYGWYQTPGHQPVVVNVMSIKAQQQ